MCQLFESIRVEDGKVVNLIYHQRRVARSCSLVLADYISAIELPSSGLYKLRISYCDSAFVDYRLERYVAKVVKTLRLVFDDTVDYSCKREDRSVLNRLFEERGDCDDVLIVRRGLVCDSSYCNVLFYDGERWFTPSEPLLEGSCRARLLERGVVTACDITVNDLFKYSRFMLINAMLDFDENRTIEVKNGILQ